MVQNCLERVLNPPSPAKLATTSYFFSTPPPPHRTHPLASRRHLDPRRHWRRRLSQQYSRKKVRSQCTSLSYPHLSTVAITPRGPLSKAPARDTHARRKVSARDVSAAAQRWRRHSNGSGSATVVAARQLGYQRHGGSRAAAAALHQKLTARWY